jgi:polyisoprenoid-binding protein YceI
MFHFLRSFLLATSLLAVALAAKADDHTSHHDGIEHYVIDTSGAHAFVQFKIKHLGFSWLYGRFNEFEGSFTFDRSNPSNSSVDVTIETASIDSNHERRDNHLKGEDFLNVESHPQATFKSTSFEPLGDERFLLTGDFTFMGITKPLSFEVTQIGAGQDPWGNERRGFHGVTQFALADFGINYNLGPDAKEVEIILDIEGIRQTPNTE